LKNKKGAQTQKFVQQITHQVKNAGQSAAKVCRDVMQQRLLSQLLSARSTKTCEKEDT
jgi:hypothetical protein